MKRKIVIIILLLILIAIGTLGYLFIDSINWTVNKHGKKIVIIEADDIP